MQANAFAVSPDAPRAEVEALVARAAERMGIEAPSIAEDRVVFPTDQNSVGEALDAVDPDWRGKGLLLEL